MPGLWGPDTGTYLNADIASWGKVPITSRWRFRVAPRSCWMTRRGPAMARFRGPLLGSGDGQGLGGRH
jgi:hypothetical protein